MALKKYSGVVTTRFEASEFGLVYCDKMGEVPFGFDKSVYAKKGQQVVLTEDTSAGRHGWFRIISLKKEK